MSSAKMTILGLYRYGAYDNQDLFKNMKIPAGIDRQDLINNILEQGAAFEILYPDFEYLQFSIGAWSKRWYRTMEKWQQLLEIKYNPLDNYDRHEEWTDKDNVTGKTETEAGVTTTGEDELSVTAYDSDTYHNKEKTDTTGTSNSSGSSATETDSTGNHFGHMWGNIGTVTAQSMFREEADVDRFNLIQQITDLFLTEFCIMVY